ncbi:hypothetical protein DSM106972_064560 [Dulcicalothrix desertica PCC 7102]|uniref:Universal stress family protein n=1 Tax=Dulcicalothrix desertica PCC 7102 TaxID=232991 RepID=A0A433V6V1_9CYAN|nr:hypothetical protein DSM106972_064560 [Dulcicalothrix desertica PCC 7102]TWH42986.1 hypothetical protein CAL7102_06675 [Dulcicalothrix desertica PCC 7102]
MKAVKIKPMLTRLQNTIGRDDLIEQMVLAPEPPISIENKSNSGKFIVGYNSSRQSHTALDIALCMAHQARLASNMQIIVQAVYVVEDNQSCYIQETYLSIHQPVYADIVSTSVLTEARLKSECLMIMEQTDAILCQARSLAEEWQVDFDCLLRFGCAASELKQIVELEGADVLFLGCNSVKHPIIKSFGADLQCTILGIPSSID